MDFSYTLPIVLVVAQFRKKILIIFSFYDPCSGKVSITLLTFNTVVLTEVGAGKQIFDQEKKFAPLW